MAFSYNSFFDEANLRNLSDNETLEVSNHYRQELLNGLEGKPSSVAMLPTFLKPVKLGDLKEGLEALVVEIGGTNLYGARVVIRSGKPEIVLSEKDVLQTTVFDSVNAFCAQVLDGISTILEGESPDAIAIVYSFPGETIKNGRNVDILSQEILPKEFVIPGISKNGIGETFLKALQTKYKLSEDIPFAVLNDTIAVLFSTGSSIGGVVGTGFNLAINTPKGIVNSESGGFDIRYTNKYANEVDLASLMKGKHLAEKQISGLYLGEQMKLIIRDLELEKEYPPSMVTSETISEILSNKNSNPALLEAAVRLRNRSSQILGIMVGTTIKTFPDIFIYETINVPIEGSVFWGIEGYEEKTREAAEKISEKNVHYLNVDNAGRIGASIAALSLTL